MIKLRKRDPGPLGHFHGLPGNHAVHQHQAECFEWRCSVLFSNRSILAAPESENQTSRQQTKISGCRCGSLRISRTRTAVHSSP